MSEPKQLIKTDRPVILIVDDTPHDVQILKNSLGHINCELITSPYGQQAINIIGTVKPDLIMLDIVNSTPAGFDIYRMLNSSLETKKIPVIFISGKTKTADIINGFEPGTVDYITKPFRVNELLSRVKTHLTLKKMKESLLEEVGTKNKFFSIISHDLRGSLGIILNAVEILQKNQDKLSPHERDEMLDIIGHTSKNTLELLEDLLDWAKSQTGGMKFNPVKLELEPIISEVIKKSNDMASGKNIEMVSFVKPLSLNADRNMLLLILRNLLSNAIKFTPPGGKISLSADAANGIVKIEVADTGVGIDPEKMDKLFRIDNKISTPGTQNEQGNGMGLILCREFIRHHKGEIGIESVTGKGTKAWVTLPEEGITSGGAGA